MRILKVGKMAEGRRHSVEIPLSKTLVALRRVRSLRDPSTNSINKFSIAIDDLNWEANPYPGDEVCLNFGKLEKDQVQPPQNVCLEFMQDPQNNMEDEYRSRIPENRNAASKKCSVIKIKGPFSKRAALVRQSRQCGSHKPLEHVGVPPSSYCMEEEVDSCSGANVDADNLINRTITKKKFGYAGWKSSPSMMEDVNISRVGSPCLSASGIRTSLLSRGTLGILNTDNVDPVDSNYSGCGIGYCWSRTPKYKDTTMSSEFECQEQPLLSAEGGNRSCKDFGSFPKSSMSASQKFRPKSFNELVGLNVITTSLMNAILRGNVASVYLFHGPRGTGKTSTARIFAAALNCLSLEAHRPCGFCRECTFIFSGKSRDVKELYAGKLNHRDRVKILLKNVPLDAPTSQFKVYIIEECHLLRKDILSGILNNIEEHSRHVVFVLITSNPDKLPRSLISQCQSYHFPKVKEDDIFCKLQRICVEEGYLFERDALSFISIKANGSLHDAETLLDQLALLGKNITLSLTHELIGIVSDDELLDLLDLALSEDTSNTVRRARDLMRSRIDPMQLVLQLANLIMDILSGRCQPEVSEAGRKFFGKHATSESGTWKLKHALRILSDTEKQLRTSKNQATWVTVALLQFNTRESCLADEHEYMGCSRVTFLRDQDVLESNPATALQNFVCYGCNKLNCSGRLCNKAKLETIWSRTMAVVEPVRLRSFLQKEGNLSALHFCEGQAIVTIEFYNLDHVIKAEKCWRSIASSFLNVLGCNILVRIKLFSRKHKKNSKLRKFSFGFLSCSGIKQEVYDSNITDEHDIDDPKQKESVDKTFYSNDEHKFSPHIAKLDAKLVPDIGYFHDKEIVSASRIEETAQHDVLKSPLNFAMAPKLCNSVSTLKAGEELCDAGNEESEVPPSCFTRIFDLHKRKLSSGASHTMCLNIYGLGKTEFSLNKKAVNKAYFLGYETHEESPASNALVSYSSGKCEMPVKYSRSSSRLFCWRPSASSP
ncbi:hypothetical protein HPP92_026959 [Vanilla planifolia]|uniref:DNA-directed DNA polymerase n=1 Tax=Vanilla planifolia TaxID=51239 RepID=A0A835PCI3_VANPL|nr:hypothetical protein HPP92_027097 [Vanilla planifolia]KAG0450048.1 hypothetical protein HPP92_026959 [Vanilla planifolia]